MDGQALAVDAGYSADDAAHEMADIMMTAEAEPDFAIANADRVRDAGIGNEGTEDLQVDEFDDIECAPFDADRGAVCADDVEHDVFAEFSEDRLRGEMDRPGYAFDGGKEYVAGLIEEIESPLRRVAGAWSFIAIGDRPEVDPPHVRDRVLFEMFEQEIVHGQANDRRRRMAYRARALRHDTRSQLHFEDRGARDRERSRREDREGNNSAPPYAEDG